MTNIPTNLPSADLIWRVADHRDPALFWTTGRMSVECISTMLGIVGKSFASYGRALEFGCGCGRILLHMEEISRRTELHAVDIDAEAIEWVQKNIPWVDASVNEGLPPLKFRDAFFDLIFNQSVFTHLDEDYQDAWLAELARVTRPGGVVVLSVAGIVPFMGLVKMWRDHGVDPSETVDRFRSKGFLYITDDGWKNGPFPDFYHTAFHAPWYVFRHWSKFFDIRAYVPRGSLGFADYVLLERPEELAATERLSEDPPVLAQPSNPQSPKASLARRMARRARRLLRKVR